MMGHLQRGSVQVERGQVVEEGAPLARVGNSGNTTAPHLHFQLMDGRDPFRAEGLPCKFRRYERFRDGSWEEVRDSIPEALEPIRFI
jgi:murein DD-endopeptidase MepM/ murein hydrolase activator NlpD